jgi:hypothetical protein
MRKLPRRLILCAVTTAIMWAPAPAVANGPWTHYTVPLIETQTIPFSGSYQFSNLKFGGVAGALDCSVTGHLHLEFGSTGYINAFDPNGQVTEACKGTGSLAFCQVHAMVATGLPWNISNSTKFIDGWMGSVQFSMTGTSCPLKSLETTAGPLKIVPDNVLLMTEIELHTYFESADLVNGMGVPSTQAMTGAGTAELLGDGAGTVGLAESG